MMSVASSASRTTTPAPTTKSAPTGVTGATGVAAFLDGARVTVAATRVATRAASTSIHRRHRQGLHLLHLQARPTRLPHARVLSAARTPSSATRAAQPEPAAPVRHARRVLRVKFAAAARATPAAHAPPVRRAPTRRGTPTGTLVAPHARNAPRDSMASVTRGPAVVVDSVARASASHSARPHALGSPQAHAPHGLKAKQRRSTSA